jgi:hypothetical protein
MPKLKNLAALAAAVEAGRRYARNNPDKASKYVDQAAAFVDKQTKSKYSGQIDGVVNKVKGAAGLPRTSRQGVVGNGAVQGYDTNAGYGKHQGYGQTTPVTPPVTPSTTTPVDTTTQSKPVTEPKHFPGSKDV